MRNPFKTEAEAFRFVWLTIAYCAVIVFAAWVNTWLGVAVFIAETAVLVWWLFPGLAQGAAGPAGAGAAPAR